MPNGNIRDTQIDRLRKHKQPQQQPEPQPQPQPQPEPPRVSIAGRRDPTRATPKPKQSWDELMKVWDEQNKQADQGVEEEEWKKLTPEKMELVDKDTTWRLFSGTGKSGNPYNIENRWTFTDVGGKIGKKKEQRVKGKEFWVMKITDENIAIVGKDNAGLKSWNNIDNDTLERGLDNGTIKIVKG